ncbi:MAG: bifunctional 5,10-methylenetetrahydrofolate dehydrogenase/5,10-methenyltetrahydrofolate cyclohydrolase [Raoultibacter sp.]
MAKLLSGKQVVAAMADALLPRIEALSAAGRVPTLALVRVGARPDDVSYERTAVKRAEALGMGTVCFELAADATQDQLEAVIDQVNADDSVQGCLLFRPLPAGIDERAVCNRLLPAKDIDGISQTSLAGVFTDSDEGFPPCTAAACLRLLDFYQIPVQGKRVVVVGRSLVIGKPVAMMLLRRNASVTLCHSRSENLAEITRAADIVICATGRARAFGAEYFTAGQTVLDVGISFDADGVFCGDVDFAAVEPIVGAITPVPGGLGSVTTSTTMEQTVCAAQGLGALQ